MSNQRDIIVREVGMRDGLQMVKDIFPTDAKLRWLQAEADAGIPEIEVCSFVPVHVVPQFQDHAEIVEAGLKIPGLTVSALVPNARGAARGFELGVDKLNFVLSASETHNLKNVRCTTEESLGRLKDIFALRNENPAYAGIDIAGGISTALGCTMEGKIDPARVMWIAEEMLKLGVSEIMIADTVGYANPALVHDVFRQAVDLFAGDARISAHFHDTRGLGLANVVAALNAGITEFDASMGGLGGCPFAPAATGNIVMEDLVFMLEEMGLNTGVDLEKLISIREIIDGGLPDDEPLYGAIARAGLPKPKMPEMTG